VPAPVHPRDPAEGRQLSTNLTDGVNARHLAFLPAREPTSLRGCTGTRDVTLRSLPERRESGAPPRDDGTFPTTMLDYRFWVGDDSGDDPACTEQFPEYTCRETLLVEVTRLTP
jgi:hypothetical protein